MCRSVRDPIIFISNIIFRCMWCLRDIGITVIRVQYGVIDKLTLLPLLTSNSTELYIFTQVVPHSKHISCQQVNP